MRIISKIKDYYDSGAMFGVDMSTVYERKPLTVDTKHPFHKRLNGTVSKFYLGYGNHIRYKTGKTRHSTEYTDYLHGKNSIIVYGKRYKFFWAYNNNYRSSLHGEFLFFWNETDLLKWLEELIPADYFDSEILGKHLTIGSEPWDKVFSITSISDNLKTYMLENRIVSISHNFDSILGDDVVINTDNLRRYGIQKVVDSTTMFHEIDQWVSMMQDPSRKMVDISDKDKIVKHGMDETSFRKMKESI